MERSCNGAMLCFWAFFVLIIGSHQAFGCLTEERNALLLIKAEFNYPNYTSLPSWNAVDSSDCCAWEKIKCDGNTGRVIEISLNFTREYLESYDSTVINSINVWSLNASLFLPFKELRSLDLSNNFLSGWTETNGFKILSSLGNLKSLDLHWNNFRTLKYVGTISSLKALDLGSNGLEGSFPNEELTTLTNLEKLDLSVNYLNGSISPSIGSLNFLKTLSLRNNHLVGSLPFEGLCKLKNIQELDFSVNKLEGSLPLCLGNLKSLRLLDLSENLFKGSIPHLLIPSLTSLEYLSLSNNRFGGLISFGSFANLSKLQVFKLECSNYKVDIETEYPPNWTPTFQLKILQISNCIVNRGSGVVPSFLSKQYDLRSVDLSNNALRGYLPTWLIGTNDKLEALNLMNNFFVVPRNLSSVHTNPNIYKLDISANTLRGRLPPKLGYLLPNLGIFNASGNALQGGIPKSIGQMKKLQLLDLSNNNFSGEIPNELIMGCFSLTILRLSNNSLHGQVFPRNSNLTELYSLYLDDNHFDGIGRGLSFSNYLNTLSIRNNHISGRLPSWIGNLSNLQTLTLSKNQFKGPIPTSFCNLNKLVFFDLSRNNFSGAMPSCFNQSSLRYIHLQGNGFTGSLPNVLARSPDLVTLDLRDNHFFGTIPNWISKLLKLRILLLKGNNLHGYIPTQLCHLNKLGIADLSRNRLSGSIPSCLKNITLSETESDEFRLSYGWTQFRSLFTYSYENKLDDIITRFEPNQYEEEFIAAYRTTLHNGDL
ncbi:hypothetical protein Sjap_011099 [Stephania japonica]|uniref:Leucine-rich repeat-containing N-terminal plant-type domain-containing protein n=1 Tax=Stephania japonica TaxID=461633 RepID=A0AAP0P4E2_9MAGN